MSARKTRTEVQDGGEGALVDPSTFFHPDDPDLAALNNPDVLNLAEPPLLGARPAPSEMFGLEADTFGRASSPKLYAAAAQFPTATQFRVWRWENGIPVGLGAIDCEATEDDFVRQFIDAMPKPGEGRFQFRLRPIDIRGTELGKEFTINISEHHMALKQFRERKRLEKEEGAMPWGHPGRAAGGDIIVNPGGGDSAGASYAEEMGRMFEHAVESAEARTQMLQSTLEEERNLLREEERRRSEERISMAERTANVVQTMTEKMMATDRIRSEEALKSQEKQSSFVMNTLTSVFQQQQEAARIQAERLREADMLRMQQDREFYERQRMEAEAQRQRERDEFERKRLAEAAEWERRQQQERSRLEDERARLEAQRRFELEQARAEADRKEKELERRREIERAEIEARMEQVRMEAERREKELERKRELEKSELQIRLDRDRMELEARREAMKAEQERYRLEMEEKRRAEAAEFERKMKLEQEERDRRERMDRERWEREKLAAEQRREDERREWERREALRREEMQREADRRREETQMQMKQMEMTAQRDREHAERMLEMARIEREAQREAQLQREKQEREAREAAERDRQRQHDMALKELEVAKERDREHQERMLQLQKLQMGGGLGSITETLGLNTADVLEKIFGRGEEPKEGGWAESVPKVLGTIAEMAQTAMRLQAQKQTEAPRPRLPSTERMIPVQTPSGTLMVPASELSRMMAGGRVEDLPQHPTVPAHHAHPPAPEPRGSQQAPVKEEVVPSASPDEAPASPTPAVPEDYLAVEGIDPVKRAKDAGIPPIKQRPIRKALRELVQKLNTSPEEDWTPLAVEALTRVPQVLDYLKAVTVSVALVEAGASPDLFARVTAALKASGIVPDDIPYNEPDLLRLQKQETP